MRRTALLLVWLRRVRWILSCELPVIGVPQSAIANWIETISHGDRRHYSTKIYTSKLLVSSMNFTEHTRCQLKLTNGICLLELPSSSVLMWAVRRQTSRQNRVHYLQHSKWVSRPPNLPIVEIGDTLNQQTMLGQNDPYLHSDALTTNLAEEHKRKEVLGSTLSPLQHLPRPIDADSEILRP
ncbi:hypothetical protein RvY_07729 [Ramazzottius varieornatus]|uniref:Secreted protein n=1 Tax=Ramazzottius varieornatus TaxID=947166 RepID=A0A1D1V3B5_RAMVA|nr:hypothetical protein RvY_07729 [Ramazzottius varieornatus]